LFSLDAVALKLLFDAVSVTGYQNDLKIELVLEKAQM